MPHKNAWLLTGILTLGASSALAWDGTEHEYIGTQAYHLACLTARQAYAQSPHAAFLSRLNVACTPVGGLNAPPGSPFTYEQLMGEWSALAADHTQSPEQLTSIHLGEIVVDNRLFARIVMTNYRHFYPASLTSWRADHLKSLQAASTAADRDGIEMVESFEAAMAIQAFAQHYLQDSFASGHMGFNRVASSNAAALAYHDHWSRRGRCVANSKNEAWYTYGDGKLGASRDGAAHVIRTAFASLYDFLTAFIEGRVDSTQWQVIWADFPATFNDSVTVPIDCVPGQSWPALRTVSRPAEAVLTYELSTVTDSSIYRPAARGVMIGGSLDSGAIPVGYRTIQTRVFSGVGMTAHQIGGHAFILDFGQVAHVGTSLQGALTHEVGFGEMIYFRPRGTDYYQYWNVSVRLLYAANLEMGTTFLRLQTGAAHASGVWGPHVALSIGVVRRSRK